LGRLLLPTGMSLVIRLTKVSRLLLLRFSWGPPGGLGSNLAFVGWPALENKELFGGKILPPTEQRDFWRENSFSE